MRQAARAPVKPRILSTATGAALPLEDEVQSLLDRPGRALVQLAGAPGSGKTTALAHLADVFSHESRLRCVDEGGELGRIHWSAEDVIIFVGRAPESRPVTHRLLMAPWGRDELIEYLLAVHPQDCAAVLARISSLDIQMLRGSPELWQPVLEELVRDRTLPSPTVAILRYLRTRVANDRLWEQFGLACLRVEAGLCEGFGNHLPDLHGERLDAGTLRILRHAPARLLMAAEGMAAQLGDSQCQFRLPAEMSPAFVVAVARRIASSATARAQLEIALRTPAEQSMAASLLYAIDPRWRPPSGTLSNLAGAYLDGVLWAEMQLFNVRLRDADLSRADLRDAKLDHALAANANFSRARLNGASLALFVGAKADFSGADLTGVRGGYADFQCAKFAGAKLDGADLSGVRFVGADLSGASLQGATLNHADFQEAKLKGVDFTGADLSKANFSDQVLRDSCLTGACLAKTTLCRADLEGMQLDGSDLPGARLSGALLTGASMQGADLTGCVLQDAGLADIDWEDACLRGADLRGASFHLGSSRSGLVGSPIASEGTRTGFYTDDFCEQDFKPPEEIRKANLRNADLRGALIDGVDFYLVDLRGAKYDAKQAEHFRRCGAILEDRCPQ
jgi:uncharacterized protein YjbI with pentapeptide repeats/energy-coupling factor transporter ATP-binding protein EcfA2